MKTKIKTKQLLSIINPFEDGIEYKGKHFKINLLILNEYIVSPQNKNILQKTTSDLENLYKNIALYIINHDIPSLISLDLEREPSINSGVFEFIKSIYKKEDFIYIDLHQEGDNSLFIKSKKLKEIDIHLPMAMDTEYIQESSIFSSNNEKINIDTKKEFLWQDEETIDNYSSIPWLINKIESIINNVKKTEDLNKEIDLLIQKIDFKSLNLDNFHKEFFSIDNSNKFWVINPQSLLFNIDFNKEYCLSKIQKEIEENDLSTISFLFENKKNYPSFNFEPYINHSNSIDYLINKSYYSGRNDNNFNLVNAYPYLSKEKKENKDIIIKYLTKIIDKDSYHNYLPNDLLYNIPLICFNDKDILKKILPNVYIGDLKEKIKSSNIKIDLLNDKTFLLDIISHSDTPHNKSVELFKLFPEKDIDSDFILTLTKRKPSLFSSLYRNSIINNILKNNIELIIKISEAGIDFDDISVDLLEDTFLQEADTKAENFKLLYLISRRYENSASFIFSNKEDIKSFNDKYLKIENMVFINHTSQYNSNETIINKLLKKIKTIEQFKELMHNTEKHIAFQYFDVDYRTIYKNLPIELQHQISLLKEFNQIISNIKFDDLPETLKYNREIALQFVSREPNSIPVEFFNDIEFALSYAESLDKRAVRLNDSPPFISKFFENHNVNSNFHDYLSRYIKVVDLKENLVKKPATTRRNKI